MSEKNDQSQGDQGQTDDQGQTAGQDQGTGEAGDQGQTSGDDQTAGQQQDGGNDDFDPDRAMRTIKNLRQREKDLAAKVKEYEDKDKTEQQRAADAKAEAERERDEAKSEAQRLKLQVAASNADARNPETVARLADVEAHDGDEAAAIEALKVSDPYLFKSKQHDADSGGPTNPGRGKKEKLTREKIAQMSYEETQQRQAEIQQFFKNNR